MQDADLCMPLLSPRQHSWIPQVLHRMSNIATVRSVGRFECSRSSEEVGASTWSTHNAFKPRPRSPKSIPRVAISMISPSTSTLCAFLLAFRTATEGAPAGTALLSSKAQPDQDAIVSMSTRFVSEAAPGVPKPNDITALSIPEW